MLIQGMDGGTGKLAQEGCYSDHLFVAALPWGTKKEPPNIKSVSGVTARG